jgi:hypothetical protein
VRSTWILRPNQRIGRIGKSTSEGSWQIYLSKRLPLIQRVFPRIGFNEKKHTWTPTYIWV